MTLLYDDDADGVAGATERVEQASASGLNHGIAIDGGYLYASSASTVYRWPYTAGDRQPLGAGEAVVTGLPSDGHSTRTLVFDASGRLYVSIGSDENVDNDSSRARIVRCASALAAAPEGSSARCPDCGATLVARNGKYGNFIGCSGYPRCRYTRDDW